MRAFGYAKRNIRRTPYQALAASMVMFITFLTLLVFLIMAFGSQKILQFYESKPQVIAFFKDNATEADAMAIQNALIETEKVTEVKYVSKEEALRNYRDKNKDKPALLDLVTANYLPTSIEISTITPQELGTVAEILKKEPVVEEVVYPEDVIQNLTRATSVVRWIGGLAVIFLTFFSFLVILMIIGFKIRIKRTEIETMKLLGASKWFIRAPFIVEGISYGVAGAIAAWVLSYTALWYMTPFVNQFVTEPKLLPVDPLFMLLLLAIILGAATVIGALGSYGALRRYLHL